jgi:hypothetical protein
MRRLQILSCLFVSTILLTTSASAQTHWVATLVGANESPAVSTSAVGQFDATLSAAQDNMTFTLTYTPLAGTMTQANIHRGVAGVNGPIIYWLANGNVSSAITGCADPTPLGGGCGFMASDFSDLQGGNLYVNLHSSFAPNGEIRGQITSAVSVQPNTWGKMKALYRN